MSEAKDLAEITPKFPTVNEIRILRKTKQFTYELKDQPVSDPQQNFKVFFFNFILAVAINSLQERFEQMQIQIDRFEFLYNIRELKERDKSYILNCCNGIQIFLTDSE